MNETHITEEILESELSLDGYNIVRCDSHNRYTGGVLYYIKKEINYQIFYEKVFEQWLWVLGVNIELDPHCSYNVLCIYRSPSASKAEFLDVLDEISNEIQIKNLIIIGDFNIDILKKEQYSERLITEMDNKGLQQLVRKPTRITQNSKTIIDLVFTNIPNIAANVLNSPKLSDHSIIEIYSSVKFNISFHKTPIEKQIKTRDLKSVNSEIFQNIIIEESWLNLSNQNIHINCLTDQLYFNIQNTLDIVAPLKIKTIPNHFRRWYDDDIKAMTREKDLKYKIACIGNTDEQWDSYRKARNLVTSTIKRKKKYYFSQEIDKSKNPRHMWKNLKQACDLQMTNQIVKMKFNNSTYLNELDIANNYNKFVEESILELINDGTKTNCTVYPYINSIERTGEFVIQEISQQDILKAIKKLKKKDSTDIVNEMVLSLGGEFLLAKVHEIINMSIREGMFPQKWKQSVITPIPKKQNSLDPSDFRPINSLPFLEKVFESIVHSQLLEYINKNDILTSNQSGFREKHSCETSLQLTISRWKKWLDKPENLVITVSLDLRRAFETVNQDLLLKKLKIYGFSDNALKWFTCYLKNRTHVTKVNSEISEPQINRVGVPQGSILGPLLFILYINDIDRCIDDNVFVNLFADDTLISVEDCNIDSAVMRTNRVLRKIENWLNVNKLFINCAKSKVMLMGRSEENISPIILKGVNLEYVESFKYLGVIVDKKLNFKNHFNELIENIKRKVNYLYRCSNNLNMNNRIKVYKSIISPNFYYCPTILYFGTQENINKLQLLQNKCLRTILRCDRYTPVRNMLECLKLLNVKDFLYSQTMCFIYKLIHEQLPTYLRFKMVSDIHEHYTRGNNRIYISKANKETTKNSLNFRGFEEFNSLPDNIKNATSLIQFKNQLRNEIGKH